MYRIYFTHLYDHLYDHLYENTLRSAFSAFAERRASMQYRHELKLCVGKIFVKVLVEGARKYIMIYDIIFLIYLYFFYIYIFQLTYIFFIFCMFIDFVCRILKVLYFIIFQDFQRPGLQRPLASGRLGPHLILLEANFCFIKGLLRAIRPLRAYKGLFQDSVRSYF